MCIPVPDTSLARLQRGPKSVGIVAKKKKKLQFAKTLQCRRYAVI